MKNLLFIALLTLPALLFGATKQSAQKQAKVLVVASSHNVTSEYYPISIVARDMKMDEGSFEKELNGKLIYSLVENNDVFVPVVDSCTDSPQEALSQSNADYVVIIHNYDFDQRFTPMNTVFHLISYSLYNRNGDCILKNTDHFSTMTLVEMSKLYPQMQKCSKKISKNILSKIS